MKFKELLQVTGLPIVFASLCCLSPLIFVLFGVATVSFGASLADTLYGEYKWIFRIFGLLALLTSFVLYLRRKNICTMDQVKRRRNEVINTFLLVITTGIFGYLFFLYVVVHYAGVWLKIWT